MAILEDLPELVIDIVFIADIVEDCWNHPGFFIKSSIEDYRYINLH